MSQTILYPFRIDTDFHLGYAWAAELTRRLKGRLLLFTTVDTTPSDSERLAEVYRALADAQGAYIRNFQILNLRLKPVKSERNFVPGEFTPEFSTFLEQRSPDILVLQEGLLPNTQVHDLIRTRHKAIILSPANSLQTENITRKTSAQLFLDIYHHANLYNIPPSFFKTISRDITLFNHLATFFRNKN